MCTFSCLLCVESQEELSARLLLSDAAWFDLIPYVVTFFKVSQVFLYTPEWHSEIRLFFFLFIMKENVKYRKDMGFRTLYCITKHVG